MQAGPRLPIAVAVAAVVALALKILLAARTLGTNDIHFFWTFYQESVRLGALGLYAENPHFNHPPFVLRWFAWLAWVWKQTGLSPLLLVRIPLILADVGSLLLVASLLRERLAEPAVRFLLVLVAAAPVSVLVSGFHGNNDPLMVAFVLLSVFLVERRAPDWLAGAALAIAIDFKVVPLAFCPAIFLALASWKRRIAFFGGLAAVLAVSSAPVLFQDPALVGRKVLGYMSMYGVWGIPRVLVTLPALEPISTIYRVPGKFVLVGAILALSAWMNLRREKPPLHRQIGVLSFALIALTPGFGVQYLAWLVPWIAFLRGRAAVGLGIAWTLASGAFLVLVYTLWCQSGPAELCDTNWLGSAFWSRGLPWNYANALLYGGEIVPVELACWIVVVAILVAMTIGVARVFPRLARPEQSV